MSSLLSAWNEKIHGCTNIMFVSHKQMAMKRSQCKRGRADEKFSINILVAFKIVRKYLWTCSGKVRKNGKFHFLKWVRTLLMYHCIVTLALYSLRCRPMWPAGCIHHSYFDTSHPHRVGHYAMVTIVYPSNCLSVPCLTLTREQKGITCWNLARGKPIIWMTCDPI